MDFYQDFPIFQFFSIVSPYFPWLSPYFPIFSHDFPNFSGFFAFFHAPQRVHPQLGRLPGPGDFAGGGLPRRAGGRRLAAAPRRAGLVVAGGERRGGARRQGPGMGPVGISGGEWWKWRRKYMELSGCMFKCVWKVLYIYICEIL